MSFDDQGYQGQQGHQGQQQGYQGQQQGYAGQGQPAYPGQQPGYPAGDPGQQPGYYQPAGAPQGMSGLAITGFILAFLIAPIGFILSLIAAFTTGKNKPKRGRGLAVAGLIISIVIMGGGIAAIVAASKSTIADPGCTSGKQIITDKATDPSGANLQALIDGLNAASAKANHDDVKQAMKTLATDFTQLQQAEKTGKFPAGYTSDSFLKKVTEDGNHIDDLCTIGGRQK